MSMMGTISEHVFRAALVSVKRSGLLMWIIWQLLHAITSFAVSLSSYHNDHRMKAGLKSDPSSQHKQQREPEILKLKPIVIANGISCVWWIIMVWKISLEAPLTLLFPPSSSVCYHAKWHSLRCHLKGNERGRQKIVCWFLTALKELRVCYFTSEGIVCRRFVGMFRWKLI